MAWVKHAPSAWTHAACGSPHHAQWLTASDTPRQPRSPARDEHTMPAAGAFLPRAGCTWCTLPPPLHQLSKQHEPSTAHSRQRLRLPATATRPGVWAHHFPAHLTSCLSSSIILHPMLGQQPLPCCICTNLSITAPGRVHGAQATAS